MGTLAEFGTRMRGENDINIILGMKSSKNLILKKKRRKRLPGWLNQSTVRRT